LSTVISSREGGTPEPSLSNLVSVAVAWPVVFGSGHGRLVVTPC